MGGALGIQTELASDFELLELMLVLRQGRLNLLSLLPIVTYIADSLP